MRFDIITIFPKIFDSYLKHSILKRAQEKKKIRIYIHSLRDFATDKHKTVDDRPYGGGVGMVLKIEPIYRAVRFIKNRTRYITKKKVIVFTPRGQNLNQNLVAKLSKEKQLILICGHYEGIDERVIKLADYALCIGPYILTGGELPALVVVDAVTRLIPGVLGKEQSKQEESFSPLNYIEYPQYTRPAVFKPKSNIIWRVPSVLLSGNHQQILNWRQKHSKKIK
jgi:tRNA (guanine37-N1)-methyltransferase